MANTRARVDASERWANAVAAKLLASGVFERDEHAASAGRLDLVARGFRGRVVIEFAKKPGVRASIEVAGYRGPNGRLRSEKQWIEIAEVAGPGFNTRIRADMRLMDWRIATGVLDSCRAMAQAVDHALRATRKLLPKR